MNRGSKSPRGSPLQRGKELGQSRGRQSPIVCRCNNVDQETIEKAISRGCHDLNHIYDATTAGVGACGGSCRRFIAVMLQSYLKNGSFPKEARPQNAKKRR
ncbi:MAG: (2Fe-2S)-binding protein [Bdellovibrionales bacterium]|nr:(2Fe-2S)-binding protein [Bdellovibrionales bacterium]